MIVTTQEELDAAVAAGDSEIIIDSPPGEWINVQGTARFIARDYAHVAARGSTHLEARDYAHAIGWGSAYVVGRDRARVHVQDSAIAELWGSASAVARDTAHVVARDSTHVELWDSTSAEAARYVPVHVHSASATVTGGMVIDVTALDLADLTDWAEYHGAEVVDGGVIVYKAVNAELRSERGFAYPIGKTVTCPDWNRSTSECGGGLHFSPHPVQARNYYPDATRFLRCVVPVGELVILNESVSRVAPKLKARVARVLCEVDVRGQEVTQRAIGG